MAVRRTGPGIARLRVALKGLDDVQAKVGWFESARYPDGTPVAAVAASHEFGVGVPPRPFFRPTIAAQSGKWMGQLAQGAKAVLEGRRTGVQVLETVVLGAAGDVGKGIKAVTEPALSPVTIARKGFDKPLVDTGQMLQSVTGVVEKK